jgi:hypothetical protein
MCLELLDLNAEMKCLNIVTRHMVTMYYVKCKMSNLSFSFLFQ